VGAGFIVLALVSSLRERASRGRATKGRVTQGRRQKV
jgi:hypothetical protein